MFVYMVMLEQQIDLDAEVPSNSVVDPFVQLAIVDDAIDDLATADLATLDRDWFARYARSVDELTARLDAIGIAAAAEAQRRGHDRDRGFLSTKAWVKHHVQVTGPEAHGRLQVTRMFELLPSWMHAARSGEVGIAQTRLMARVAANPRVHVALIECVDVLLADAIALGYDEFERRVRDFQRSADQGGATTQAQQHHQARDAMMRQKADGSWVLRATFGSMQGAEVNEVLAHFIQAEWETDWADARSRCGDDATMADLPRTEPQRRADATAAAFLAGATAPGAGRAPLPTLNIVIDEVTAEVVVTGGRLDPARFADMVCQTQNGDPIDCSEAAALALWGQIRRVVRNSAGVVIDLGRRSRLFTGASREAVLLLSDRCLWPGCDRAVRHCEADHSLGWKAHGNTVPWNGGAMCRAHNLLKETGSFTARRRPTGEWAIIDNTGELIDTA